MRTICYVILNYKTYEEAAACAESILSTQTWKNMHIVIVDNGSGNGSEEWLAAVSYTHLCGILLYPDLLEKKRDDVCAAE